MKPKWRWIFIVSILLVISSFFIVKKINVNPAHDTGDQIDELNGVAVYYNGGVDHTEGRNLAPDGYNIGLKYQCVEFVKRYYFEKLHHEMPDSYGHAVDFYDPDLKDGEKNEKRNLIQYSNHGKHKPQPDDLLVFDKHIFNRFGHVAIVSEVKNDRIEIVQQNPGPFGPSREIFKLYFENGVWHIEHDRVLGWLRK